jgi:hypothetical protein
VAAIAAEDVAVAARLQEREILARHHAAVADERHAAEAEAMLQIVQDRRHRLGIAPVALEDVVRDRPAVDQNESDQHLRIARLAVAFAMDLRCTP